MTQSHPTQLYSTIILCSSLLCIVQYNIPLSRDFNAGLTEAEVRLMIRNLAHFHAASVALARIKGIDLAQHYGQLSSEWVTAGKTDRQTDRQADKEIFAHLIYDPSPRSSLLC